MHELRSALRCVARDAGLGKEAVFLDAQVEWLTKGESVSPAKTAPLSAPKRKSSRRGSRAVNGSKCSVVRAEPCPKGMVSEATRSFPAAAISWETADVIEQKP